MLRGFLEAMDQFHPAVTDKPLHPDALLSVISEAVPDCAERFERGSQLLAHVEFSRGYIHGDFVPKNVLVDRSGTLKVLDWEYAMANAYRVVDAMDMALQLTSDDSRLATFQVLDAAWREDGGVTRLVGMLHRLWPPAADEVRRCGIRAISLLHLWWCAWRFARAGWPGPVRQCTDVIDRILRSPEPGDAD
jgi:hypothetical protein